MGLSLLLRGRFPRRQVVSRLCPSSGQSDHSLVTFVCSLRYRLACPDQPGDAITDLRRVNSAIAAAPRRFSAKRSVRIELDCRPYHSRSIRLDFTEFAIAPTLNSTWRLLYQMCPDIRLYDRFWRGRLPQKVGHTNEC